MSLLMSMIDVVIALLEQKRNYEINFLVVPETIVVKQLKLSSKVSPKVKAKVVVILLLVLKHFLYYLNTS